nr:hypothetical protein [Mycolicibacter terrae]
MLAEQGLDRLGLLGDRRLTHRSGGVAQPFGGLADPVQRFIAAGAGHPGGLGGLKQPPEGGVDRVGGAAPGLFGGGFFGQGPEVTEQLPIVRRVQRGHRVGPPGPIVLLGGVHQPLDDPATHQGRCHPVQRPAIAVRQHLGVPGGSEHPGQPAQLAIGRGDRGRTSERIRRCPQQAADPANAHPHLMHRVVGIGPHGTLEHRQGSDLFGNRTANRIAGVVAGHRPSVSHTEPDGAG